MAAHFGLPLESGYEDWRRMLDEAPLDAVLIATPNNLHYEQAKAALEHNLHVLLEKPMTIRSEQAHELVALAKARGTEIGGGAEPALLGALSSRPPRDAERKNGTPGKRRDVLDGSAAHLFGRGPEPAGLPGVVAPTPYRADPEQNGGGYFIDGGSHLISELIWMSGLRVRRLVALMDAVPSDMRITVSIEMENGAVASLNTIGDSKHVQRRVRNVFGAEHGTVSIIHPEFETHIQIEEQEPVKFREADLSPVANPVSNFADAILGRGELFSPGEHGAHVVEVVEAIYKSAETGRVITLPDAQP